MTYALIEPPQAEVLTLGQVKAHLRIDTSAEDDLLQQLIATAREHLERETGLCLLRQKLRLYLDRWPKDGVVQIIRGPVQAIDAATIYEADGKPVNVSLDDHLLDGQARPARLWLRSPPLPGQAVNGIEIDFTAGFGESGAEVPDPLKRAMLMHIALMYAYRGVLAPEQQPGGVPEGYERLLAAYRMRRL
ncbi:head-tail connector protein [Rhizobium helianthi]|uniref:Head-tail connector protein n=1 Tax=Rhizobium helianthi TaxID=1132695 RepID=A0ABW4M8G2_9HYPH